ncbi:hypothetical protein PHYBLDRAFT_65117 [Phycomyces blakesleeanus NRRL 1555(-)]|uniref:Uncharacterized protein n=1 Tax=Phycomyces blakesleeanus (strain ATCC 8743b / DSM 1359 / FGSC 10004 / NBRC 33097 / NRRL 1555) TaxID=763407 RepID=A0A167MIV3_PHYB8|nr:hypothetical protein PHYBLDRAFT_65117 [Phycomyces blakesleeanus NRRL 1555(-)]OAD72954.1 hypothetical protein PHYBLDRAFT_65117 [Phycomyces blakesleeanus NRRL 1555(-)]|eukprot:XP_018290994.1 hypothetical protein PHYBLDRAFT_65117 [Phycomyces blakesleeanus NRRL 1555(-)]
MGRLDSSGVFPKQVMELIRQMCIKLPTRIYGSDLSKTNNGIIMCYKGTISKLSRRFMAILRISVWKLAEKPQLFNKRLSIYDVHTKDVGIRIYQLNNEYDS